MITLCNIPIFLAATYSEGNDIICALFTCEKVKYQSDIQFYVDTRNEQI